VRVFLQPGHAQRQETLDASGKLFSA
jgi:hypothetical protein